MPGSVAKAASSIVTLPSLHSYLRGCACPTDPARRSAGSVGRLTGTVLSARCGMLLPPGVGGRLAREGRFSPNGPGTRGRRRPRGLRGPPPVERVSRRFRERGGVTGPTVGVGVCRHVRARPAPAQRLHPGPERYEPQNARGARLGNIAPSGHAPCRPDYRNRSPGPGGALAPDPVVAPCGGPRGPAGGVPCRATDDRARTLREGGAVVGA